MKFTDDILLAYLDGSLDDAQNSAIEDALSKDFLLEARLMALDPIAGAVRDAFKDIPAKTPQVALPETTQEQASAGPARLFAVAASVAVLAASVTFWTTRPSELGWAAQAAIYQSLYVPDTIEKLDSSPAAIDAQFARAEEKLGRTLKRDVLETLPGLSLKRAQILAFGDKPLIQVVFADDDGQPFAFCIVRQGDGAADNPVDLAELSGLATATWTQDGYGYMIIGHDAQTDLTGPLDILTANFAG